MVVKYHVKSNPREAKYLLPIFPIIMQALSFCFQQSVGILDLRGIMYGIIYVATNVAVEYCEKG